MTGPRAPYGPREREGRHRSARWLGDRHTLDELGYQAIDEAATNDLFRLVSARHGNKSTVVVSNTGFAHWHRFFPSKAQAVATVDRLVDDATILRFTGKSVRKPRDVHGAKLDDEAEDGAE